MYKTYRQINEFAMAAAGLLDPQPPRPTPGPQPPIYRLPEGKFKYAITRVLKRGRQALETYHDDLESLRIDHCMEDPKTHEILRDEQRQYRFTKDGLRNFTKAQRGLLDKSAEIEPHYVDLKYIPKGVINQDTIDTFVGFVIKEEDAESVAVKDEDEPAQPEADS